MDTLKGKKHFLPRSIFARAMIILITPLLLVQIITNFVFLDRHLDSVTKLLANDIVSVVNTLVYFQDQVPPKEHDVDMIANTFELEYMFLPGQTITHMIEPPDSWAEGYLLDELNRRLKHPYTLQHDGEHLTLLVNIKSGLVSLKFLRKRLWTKTTKLVFIWAFGTTILFLLIAALFMRNQLKPLENLAEAADAFGRGDDILNLNPRGATEIRQVAKAFRRMQERIKRFIDQRTEMLAGISHDLRTPLTRMKLALEILPKDNAIKSLQDDVRDMQYMIDEYLDFVRQDDMESVVAINIHMFLDQIIQRSHKSGFLVALDVPMDAQAKIRPKAFTRCIVNLLENARQYAGHACVRIGNQDGYFVIYIDDDGPGIPEGQRDNALKAFYRLDVARNQNKSGVGLGLSIVQDIMNRHGGSVLLDASPEGGLRVILKLPM